MALALTVLLLCIATELVSGAIRTALLRRAPSLPGTSVLSGPVTWADRVSGQWVSSGTRRNAADRPDQRLTPPWSPERIRRFLWIAAVAVLVATAVLGADLSLENLFRGLAQLPETLALFVPPATGGIMPQLWAQLLVTVQIALAATLLGAVLAIPIGVLAARNVVAHRGVHTFFRVLIVVVRGIPELIVAIIFVVITGLGGVAGTLALALGAVGLLSKLVADSLEETDTAVQEALRANGASRAQVFFGATARQAAPAVVAHLLYLLDTNIRSATLLGIVGAGGIGFLLLNASRVVQFDVVTTIVLMILGVVLAVEALSMWIRTALR
jgi:phosphonate transport system permease protein